MLLKDIQSKLHQCGFAVIPGRDSSSPPTFGELREWIADCQASKSSQASASFSYSQFTHLQQTKFLSIASQISEVATKFWNLPAITLLTAGKTSAASAYPAFKTANITVLNQPWDSMWTYNKVADPIFSQAKLMGAVPNVALSLASTIAHELGHTVFNRELNPFIPSVGWSNKVGSYLPRTESSEQYQAIVINRWILNRQTGGGALDLLDEMFADGFAVMTLFNLFPAETQEVATHSSFLAKLRSSITEHYLKIGLITENLHDTSATISALLANRADWVGLPPTAQLRYLSTVVSDCWVLTMNKDNGVRWRDLASQWGFKNFSSRNVNALVTYQVLAEREDPLELAKWLKADPAVHPLTKAYLPTILQHLSSPSLPQPPAWVPRAYSEVRGLDNSLVKKLYDLPATTLASARRRFIRDRQIPLAFAQQFEDPIFTEKASQGELFASPLPSPPKQLYLP